MAKSPEDAEPKQLDYNVAMSRLVKMGALGCLVIFAYGFAVRPNIFGVVSVGLMAAGAALFAGGLLGFLFGVPHTREGEYAPAKRERIGGASEQRNKAATDAAPTSYRPNTSLEQISDWLTKILVGVGLVQIKVIPAKLLGLANYIARGLGGGDQANALALAILIYFSICGFVFGFLWARLYLLKWFREADLQRIARELSESERQRRADGEALALVLHQLHRGAVEQKATDLEMADKIEAASPLVREVVFGLAQQASLNKKSADHPNVTIETVISIFRGLIASDPDPHHKYYSELSYALSRKDLPDWEAAEKKLSRAIEIRDRLKAKGWKYYEFCRARYRIQQNPNLTRSEEPDSPILEQILTDLRVAHTETDRWGRWIENNQVVEKWLENNEIDVATLGYSDPPKA